MSKRRLVLAPLVMGMLTWPLPAQQPVPKGKSIASPRVAEGTRIDRDLAYGPHGERNTLDLYRPAGPGPFPLVIWIHGGAWQGGSKDGNNPALRLLEQGFAVASLNYRLSRQAIFPAQIEDCKAAIRFLRAEAGKYQLDAQHFGVWGASAGGHLAALVGTAGDVPEFDVGPHHGVSSRVQAVCDWFGPTDLLKMGAQAGESSRMDHDAASSPESKLLGGPVQEKRAEAVKANPITYVTEDDPPFLIFHGDQDPLVPWKQSAILAEALRENKRDVTLEVVKGAGHGQGIGTPEHMAQIGAFFRKHLQAARPTGVKVLKNVEYVPGGASGASWICTCRPTRVRGL